MCDKQMLMDMGFPKERVEYALKVTNDKGIEPAMEWLLAHADESIPSTVDGGGVAVAASNSASPAAGGAANSEDAEAADIADSEAVAKSLKCEDCQKILRDQGEAEYHAAKTGHANFSESTEEKKPLSAEERQQQLALIEEKLKQKRLEREERDRQDEMERERTRIRSGKDMTEVRKRIEENEMKKIMEQRKREKIEEKAARDRVRAQIEADKLARKNREANVSPEATPSSSGRVPATAPAPVPATPPTKSKDYTETRIQIRLQDGKMLQEKFNVREPLSAVRTYIQIKTGITDTFGLMTTFPRKVFRDDDYDMPLEVLDLVPSAVLTVTHATK